MNNTINKIYYLAKKATKKTHSTSSLSGTGSIPPGLYGVHRIILFIPKTLPFSKPNRSTAVIKYSEQVGVKRHVLGNKGEINFWYSLIKPIKMFFNYFSLLNLFSSINN